MSTEKTTDTKKATTRKPATKKVTTTRKSATKKVTTTRKPAAKKATTKKQTRKASADIVEAEIVTPSEYMSDVARQLAGDYDAEARERELAPIIRAKISGTLASRDKTEYAKMAVDVAAIGQEHVNAAVSGKTDIMKRTSEGIALRTDGAEAMRRNLATLAVTVDGLGGKRSIVSRLFPFFETPEKKLREFQARFQSTEESLQEITNSIRDAAMTMERDADCLDSEASYQYARIHDMAADVQAVRFIRRDAEARVEELRSTGDEGDANLADALHDSVVDTAVRRENELLGQIGNAMYACQSLAIASQSARKLSSQAIQTLNNAIPALKTQAFIRTALGTQELVGNTLDAVNKAVAAQMEENTRLMGKNIEGMVAREKDTIARVDDIKGNLDSLVGFITDAREQLTTIEGTRRASNEQLTEYVVPLVDKLEARREIEGGSVTVL